jgi:hypothetical protein
MVTETESESGIESIDVANDELIDVLTALVEYERTDGEFGSDTRMALLGEGPRRMAVPADQNNIVEGTVFRASELVSNGSLVDSIEIEGDTVDVYVR